MKKLYATVALLLAVAGTAQPAAFPTNTSSATIDIATLSHDFNDFSFEWRGYEDQRVSFTFQNNAAYIDLDAWKMRFKMSRTGKGGTNVTYILKDVASIKITDSNAWFAVANTNIPPDGAYKGEMILLTATTNVVRTLARGNVRIAESLFGTDDAAFSYPRSTWVVFTNYFQYYGIGTFTGTARSGSNTLTITKTHVSTSMVPYLASMSNALRVLWRADDAANSNSHKAMWAAGDVAVSNAVKAYALGIVGTASNNIKTLYAAADTAASNALKAMYLASDAAASNAMKVLYAAADTSLSNSVFSHGLEYLTEQASGIDLWTNLLPKTTGVSLGSAANPFKAVYAAATSLYAGTGVVSQARIAYWNSISNNLTTTFTNWAKYPAQTYVTMGTNALRVQVGSCGQLLANGDFSGSNYWHPWSTVAGLGPRLVAGLWQFYPPASGGYAGLTQTTFYAMQDHDYSLEIQALKSWPGAHVYVGLGASNILLYAPAVTSSYLVTTHRFDNATSGDMFHITVSNAAVGSPVYFHHAFLTDLDCVLTVKASDVAGLVTNPSIRGVANGLGAVSNRVNGLGITNVIAWTNKVTHQQFRVISNRVNGLNITNAIVWTNKVTHQQFRVVSNRVVGLNTTNNIVWTNKVSQKPFIVISNRVVGLNLTNAISAKAITNVVNGGTSGSTGVVTRTSDHIVTLTFPVGGGTGGGGIVTNLVSKSVFRPGDVYADTPWLTMLDVQSNYYRRGVVVLYARVAATTNFTCATPIELVRWTAPTGGTTNTVLALSVSGVSSVGGTPSNALGVVTQGQYLRIKLPTNDNVKELHFTVAYTNR